jgi:hypothetical protein
MIFAKAAVGGWMLIWPFFENRKAEAPLRPKIVRIITRKRGEDNGGDEEHGEAGTSNDTQEAIPQEGACLGNKVSEVTVKPPP